MERSTETTLNFVAHADDDLLFLSPDLLHIIHAGHVVRTVFVTAGDGGEESSGYWQSRERGIQAAYAQMCGVTNAWGQADAGIVGHPIPVFTLVKHPSVSVAFMRLPDGSIDGSGFVSTKYKSLQRLWTSAISTIDAIDGSSNYTKVTLINTIAALMSLFQPAYINTQDYVGTYDDGDHSDHHTVAYLVQTAAQQYTTPHCLTGYESYTISSRPANVTGADLVAKQDAFYAYAHHDRVIGGVAEIFPMSWRMSTRFRRIVFLSRAVRLHIRCLLKSVIHYFTRNNTLSCSNKNYIAWLQRQYKVGSEANEDNLPLQHSEGKRLIPFLPGRKWVRSISS